MLRHDVDGNAAAAGDGIECPVCSGPVQVIRLASYRRGPTNDAGDATI
ncbi:MAG TPA: hypothetical protein VJ914_38725 [Pseudonocardiaceae bacterium]|nr:hypothetical protein [Pseudonocardiaceae bacterium]